VIPWETWKIWEAGLGMALVIILASVWEMDVESVGETCSYQRKGAELWTHSGNSGAVLASKHHHHFAAVYFQTAASNSSPAPQETLLNWMAKAVESFRVSVGRAEGSFQSHLAAL